MTIVEALKYLANKISGVDISTLEQDEISEMIVHIADNLKEDYVLPKATASEIGGVKQMTVIEEIQTADAIAAAAESITKQEFDAVVTLANANKAKLNELIRGKKTAEQMAAE